MLVNSCILVLVSLYISCTSAFRGRGVRLWSQATCTRLSTDGEGGLSMPFEFASNNIGKIDVRKEDLFQDRELEDILYERARRFYDPSAIDVTKEKCILVVVDRKVSDSRDASSGKGVGNFNFSLEESLSELSELVGTAGLTVCGVVIQRLAVPHARTYVGTGKVSEIAAEVNRTLAKTLVVDDDLTPKQQRSLEDAFVEAGIPDIKILDRTAVILEIFAQHASSREGQLQVELAMLEYRLTRGPRAKGTDSDSGCGFRGPGETKVETDKRVIRDKIVLLKKELEVLGSQRLLRRKSRNKLNLPVVALVGYTNAGKSTLMNRLSRAGVLAENMLFATLDPTTRRVRLPRRQSVAPVSTTTAVEEVLDAEISGGDYSETPGVGSGSKGVSGQKGQEILLTDTVGFISKLPTNLIAAFRATLEEVTAADVLLLVCDRSSPVWEKQKHTVLRELAALGCADTPIVEVWNKIDAMEDPEIIRLEAAAVPIDIDAFENIQTDDTPVLLGSEEDIAIRPGNELPSHSSGSTTEEVTIKTASEWGEDEYLTVSLEEHQKQHSSYRNVDDDAVDSYTKRPVRRHKQLLVNEQGQATANSEEDTSSAVQKRYYYTVAASAKTGLGMDDLEATLCDALALSLVPITVFVPYSQDKGVIDMLHQQGLVEHLDYLDTGTQVRARIPEQLLAKVQSFLVQ